jgi:hypothetical protein
MGRMYVAEFENVSVSALQDFFELQPAANIPIVLHAVYLSQVTDVGDTNEEMLRVSIVRGNTTSGSGGTTQTPTPLDQNDAASGDTTVEMNNTIEASAGTEVDLHSETFNIRTGWVYMPTPEMRPRVQNAELLCVRLLVAPGSAIFMSGTIYFEEI